MPEKDLRSFYTLIELLRNVYLFFFAPATYWEGLQTVYLRVIFLEWSSSWFLNSPHGCYVKKKKKEEEEEKKKREKITLSEE